MYQIPLTKIKLVIAKLLYRLLRLLGFSNQQYVNRNGIFYELDLSEGIDLHIFLFGNFQDHIFNHKLYQLPKNAVIFDIGANIGDTTLNFAKLVKQGKVYAFEPTDYAWQKLIRNVSLNPSLYHRIIPYKVFIADETKDNSDLIAYSSWKVDSHDKKSHPYHGGLPMSATNTASITLDDFCTREKISRVDLIKIDTDGHECSVLKGAIKTLSMHKPAIIFEISQYTLIEEGKTFEWLWHLLSSVGYKYLINIINNRLITIDNYKKELPASTTTDVIALFEMPSEI